MAGSLRVNLSSSASLVLLFLLLSFSEAREILVGGKSDSWKVPSSESDSLNQWAGKMRFKVGDFLVWKYESGKDSVLQVSKENYVNCSTVNPIKEYKDGDTKVELERHGAFYFISGAKGHCQKGQKLIVVVLSPRHGHTGISPAPSPANFEGSAVAPSPTSSATSLQGGLLVAVGLLSILVF
ncbi:Early nodulin-like protein [Quillaja saponaria]|uniref:Early nodulin-like protein n=1 Tax=Quillaja saponaria TaxID=32244 RepID=A0AAD7LXR3_QUISA|nr:Early nodulin-like protein [Quillaja saponaria]